MGNLDGDSEFWDEFWKKDSPHEINEYSWPQVSKSFGLKRILDYFDGDISGLSVLECGCGSAEVSKKLLFLGVKCDLLDISKAGLERTTQEIREMGYQINSYLGDVNSIENLTGNKKYDLIYSGGLLHHVEDLGPVVDSMKNSLTKNGVIIADIIPKKFSLQSIADFEKSFIYFLRNIYKKDFSNIFTMHTHIPKTYVSKRLPKDYEEIFRQYDLNAEVYTATVYPSFALPKFLEKIYSRFLMSKYSFWKSLYIRESRLLNFLSISFTLYAKRKSTE